MTGTVLTPSERSQCETISTRADIYAQRAKALLALDEGLTQREAGEKSILTSGKCGMLSVLFGPKAWPFSHPTY